MPGYQNFPLSMHIPGQQERGFIRRRSAGGNLHIYRSDRANAVSTQLLSVYFWKETQPIGLLCFAQLSHQFISKWSPLIYGTVMIVSDYVSYDSTVCLRRPRFFQSLLHAHVWNSLA